MENANTLPKVSVYPLLGIGIVSGLFAACMVVITIMGAVLGTVVSAGAQ